MGRTSQCSRVKGSDRAGVTEVCPWTGVTTITIGVEEGGSSTMAQVVNNVHAKIDQAGVHHSIHPRRAMDTRHEIHTNHRRPHGSHHLLVLQALGSACRRRLLLPIYRGGLSMATATDRATLKASDTTSMGRHHRDRHRAWIQDSIITVVRQATMDTIRGRLAVTEVEGIKAPEIIGKRHCISYPPRLWSSCKVGGCISWEGRARSYM